MKLWHPPTALKPPAPVLTASSRPPAARTFTAPSRPAAARTMAAALAAALTLGFVVLALLPAAALAQARGGQRPEPPRDPLRFEFLGSADGGRIAAVAGVVGSPGTYYAGAASGGVWKTTDGGESFVPVFDDEPVQAIGALAVAPSDSSVVWAGTGEAWAIRDADVMGDGVYRSTDGGRTWAHVGLEATGRIGRILVHPTDPNTAYVCALGRTTGPQQERGVYRTRDGGATWRRVLFVDANTGCSGLSMDATDPDVLYAGTWQVVMHTWAMFSGGPGSGVYATRDGGDTWKRLAAGLPKAPVGKVDVAVAPGDAKRVYALIQTAKQGSLWRSDDAGATWAVVSWDRTLIGRAGYYIHLMVSPSDADEVLVANSSLHLSKDGGRTFTVARGGCGDCHDIWWDPTSADHYVVTGDGGMGITTDHGKSYTSVRLPIGQFYHVAVDDRVPYWVYGNRQDDGTMRGPSNERELPTNVHDRGVRLDAGARRFRFGGGGGGAWQHGLGGCESGFTLPVPGDADVVWASCYGDEVSRYDARLGRARSVSPWVHTLDSPPDVLKYRCHWTPPLAIDPFEPETVYYGCQVIFRTDDQGQTWRVISPDLSTRDSSRIAFSGGVVGDNLGQFYGEVVFAIAPSPVRAGLIWAGTNDGRLWYTPDRGGTWTDVTKNIRGMPAWGTIRKIEPSRFDAATAYVAVDAHLMSNTDEAYIFKTTDTGRTWTKITGDLPSGVPLSYVMAVTEDPHRRGLLFAGTGNGFYYSRDDGGHWTKLSAGLPAAPVSWIAVPDTFHDVVVSTYGRGIYVLRDVGPLEQADDVAENEPAHLFAPSPGYRQARSGQAEFRFALKDAPDSVALEILDGGGAVVRAMRVAAREGLNGASWNLLYDGPAQPELRALPPDNPHIWEEPRFAGDSVRPVIHWGTGQPQRVGPIAAPGRYAVRLTVAGRSYTQPFDVLKDASIPSSAPEIAASTRAQVRIRDDIDTTVAMIDGIEAMRKQVEALRAAHAGDAKTTQALDSLAARMLRAELPLLSRTELHSDDKWYVERNGLYLGLVWLYAEVGLGGGDVSGGAEYRPTAASLAVLDALEAELTAARAGYRALVEQTVPAFNRAMRGRVTVAAP